MNDRLLKLAIAVPVIGLLSLIARAEFALRSGSTWELPIAGYDPRDLLHGRYLNYRFRFNWQGVHSCGEPWDEFTPDAHCCVCFTAGDHGPFDPPARQVTCDAQVDPCEGWLRGDALIGPHRYFVPEDQAEALERELLAGHASVDVTCGPGGAPAIGELHVNNDPSSPP